MSHNNNPEALALKDKLYGVVTRFFRYDLFWLILFCGIRLIFFILYDIGDAYGDSETYLNYDANILQGHVDILRTPVYPYFIKIIKLLGTNSLSQKIVLVQAGISVFSIFIFYKIVSDAFRGRIVILTATLLYGIMPSLLNFDKCVLTESLSISAIVFFLYLITRYLRRPSASIALLIALYIFLTIMLRPSFIILIPVVLMFWILRIFFYKAERGTGLAGILGLSACVLLVMGYSGLNFKNNGYDGISAVSGLNRLDIVINANMYMDGNDPEVSEMIKENLPATHGAYSDMYFMLAGKFSHKRIAKFLTSCIVNQPGVFIRDGFMRLMILGKSTTRAVYVSAEKGLPGKLLNILSHFLSINFFIVYIILLLDLAYIMFKWFKNHKVLWFKIVLFSIITVHLITIILGAQGEYNRLFVIALPAVIVLLFGYLDMFVNRPECVQKDLSGQ